MADQDESSRVPATFQGVVDEVLESGHDDWVNLHDVVWLSTGGDRSAAAKQRTLRVLRHLFAERLMTPGDLGAPGFSDWPGDTEEHMRRAADDLERLGWNPMGDGFWLRLTSDT